MKKTSKLVPVIAAVFTLISAIFRIFQLLVVVDYNEMGFFDTKAGFFPTSGLYVVFGVTAAALIIGAVIDNKNMSGAYFCTPQSLTPKQTAVLGVSFLAAACLKFYDIVFGYKGMSLDFAGEAIIFAVFALIGFMFLARREIKPAVGYLQLLLALSFTIKSGALFIQDTVIVRVSDELILLLSYVVSVLFFLSLGRFISSNEEKHTRARLFVCGGMAAAFSACVSLSGYIAYFIDKEYMSEHMEMHPLSQLGVTIVALAVIFILYSENKSFSNPADEGDIDGQ